MAQFDSLIIFPLTWALLVILLLYYNKLINIIIPNFVGTKKFRGKKLESSNLFKFFKKIVEVRSEKAYKEI
jgi:hypothetical protein